MGIEKYEIVIEKAVNIPIGILSGVVDSVDVCKRGVGEFVYIDFHIAFDLDSGDTTTLKVSYPFGRVTSNSSVAYVLEALGFSLSEGDVVSLDGIRKKALGVVVDFKTFHKKVGESQYIEIDKKSLRLHI